MQILFSKRNILNRYSTLAAVKLNKFVYPDPAHIPALRQAAGSLPYNPAATKIRNSLSLLSSFQLILNVIYNCLDVEQVAELIDIGVLFEFGKVGMRHFLSQFR